MSIELDQWAVSHSYEPLDHSNQISSSRLLLHEMRTEFVEWVMLTFENNDKKITCQQVLTYDIVRKYGGRGISIKK